VDTLGRNGTPEPIMVRNPVAVVDLGVGSRPAPPGLTVAGRIYWPQRPDLPAIVVDETGRPSLVRNPREAKGHPGVRQCPPRLVGGERVSVPGGLGPGEDGGSPRRHLLGVDRHRRAFYLTRRTDDLDALLRPLEELAVYDAVALPPTPEDASRVWLVGRADGGIHAEDPLRQRALPLAELATETTRLYLAAADPPGRVTRLRLPDVELSRVEARRQRRLLEEIASMRQALREVANRKYRAYIEKVRLRREQSTGVKEWDGPGAVEIPDNDR